MSSRADVTGKSRSGVGRGLDVSWTAVTLSISHLPGRTVNARASRTSAVAKSSTSLVRDDDGSKASVCSLQSLFCHIVFCVCALYCFLWGRSITPRNTSGGAVHAHLPGSRRLRAGPHHPKRSRAMLILCSGQSVRSTQAGPAHTKRYASPRSHLIAVPKSSLQLSAYPMGHGAVSTTWTRRIPMSVLEGLCATTAQVVVSFSTDSFFVKYRTFKIVSFFNRKGKKKK